MILTGVAIFLLNAVNDYFAVTFVRQVTVGNAGRAALCAVGIEIVAFLTVLAWVESAYFLIPAVLGVSIGTFWTVRRRSGGKKQG